MKERRREGRREGGIEIWIWRGREGGIERWSWMRREGRKKKYIESE